MPLDPAATATGREIAGLNVKIMLKLAPYLLNSDPINSRGLSGSIDSHILRIRSRWIGEEYKFRSSSFCGFLQRPVISSLFDPNILLSTIFSNTFSLCSSLNVRYKVSHPYNRTTGKIVVLCIPIFMFFRQQTRG
jgi:hypothetical protein